MNKASMKPFMLQAGGAGWAVALVLMSAVEQGALAQEGASSQPEERLMLAEAARRRPGDAVKPKAQVKKPRPMLEEQMPAKPGSAQDEERRMRPGETPEVVEEDVVPDPNAATGLSPIAPPALADPSVFAPIPDRWRLINDLKLVKENWYDPYNRNILKADRPFYRDWFFNMNLISDTVLEPRRVPVPVAPQVGHNAGALNAYGTSEQFLFNQNFITSFVIYKGNTVFKPPEYEFHLTPVFNINHTDVSENRLLNIDPRKGTTRTDGFAGMQELFLDYHLQNVSPRYDFDSVRFGIQPFSADFRGFLFQDNQMGVRFFGNRDNNLWQYNIAWFRRLEKDINSGLNSLTKTPRDDDVFAFNAYRQDFLVRGFTAQSTVVYNRNREGSNPFFFDKNGFLQRPASLGLEKQRSYDVVYLGLNGDGHFGRLNLTTSFYYAIGESTRSAFVNERTDIRAYFAAAEASMDFDWLRVRTSALYASGDDDPYDHTEEGFDAIFENPLFAGSDSSFWIRQSVPNINGGGVALSSRNGLLNSLRPSKEQGQSNFTNPGIQLYGLGFDLDLISELRLSFNFNKLFFANTAVLNAARNQGRISNDIGWDLSTALIYRPNFSQNTIFRLSGAILTPGDGFKQLFVDQVSYSVLGNIVLAY
jgi:hypothetical protein